VHRKDSFYYYMWTVDFAFAECHLHLNHYRTPYMHGGCPHFAIVLLLACADGGKMQGEGL